MSTHPEPPRAAFLAAVLARALPDAAPYAIAQAVAAMIHAAKAHKRASEVSCSYPQTEAQEVRTAKRLERLAREARLAVYRAAYPADAPHAATGGFDAFDKHGATLWQAPGDPVYRTIRLTFGGDPRGACGQLIVSDTPGDGFGPGFAIYD